MLCLPTPYHQICLFQWGIIEARSTILAWKRVQLKHKTMIGSSLSWCKRARAASMLLEQVYVKRAGLDWRRWNSCNLTTPRMGDHSSLDVQPEQIAAMHWTLKEAFQCPNHWLGKLAIAGGIFFEATKEALCVRAICLSKYHPNANRC